ncbi:MAG TPA: hypothetical protein VFT98_16190 [Myxococcota bacterium]|nr:hypothetical protein [Myxococcota bacterium]
MQAAIKSGRLKRAKSCSKCGLRASRIDKIHAHHPDYSKPLEVEWLCALCHKREHARIRKEAA